LDEEQYSLREGRNSIDAMCILQQIIEEGRVFTLPVCILFIDYGKTCGSLDWEKQ
jgi:hypothetical protein